MRNDFHIRMTTFARKTTTFANPIENNLNIYYNLSKQKML